MDFTYTDEQQAITELSHRILSEQLPPERLRALERDAGVDGSGWFADDVWAALADADLLGLALPEAHGGGGYGLLEACLVAEQARHACPPSTAPCGRSRAGAYSGQGRRPPGGRPSRRYARYAPGYGRGRWRYAGVAHRAGHAGHDAGGPCGGGGRWRR